MNTTEKERNESRPGEMAVHLWALFCNKFQHNEGVRKNPMSETDKIHNEIIWINHRKEVLTGSNKLERRTLMFRSKYFRNLLKRMSKLTIRDFIQIFPIPVYIRGEVFSSDEFPMRSVDAYMEEALIENEIDLYDADSLNRQIGNEIVRYVFSGANQNPKLDAFRRQIFVTALSLLSSDNELCKKYGDSVEAFICDIGLENQN